MTAPRADRVVIIYTDGACSQNPGPGGWGALLRYGSVEKALTGGAAQTTNNRMELQAAIEGLAALKWPCAVQLHTDSTYVKNGITRWIHGWRAMDLIRFSRHPTSGDNGRRGGVHGNQDPTPLQPRVQS